MTKSTDYGAPNSNIVSTNKLSTHVDVGTELVDRMKSQYEELTTHMEKIEKDIRFKKDKEAYLYGDYKNGRGEKQKAIISKLFDYCDNIMFLSVPVTIFIAFSSLSQIYRIDDQEKALAQQIINTHVVDEIRSPEKDGPYADYFEKINERINPTIETTINNKRYFTLREGNFYSIKDAIYSIPAPKEFKKTIGAKKDDDVADFIYNALDPHNEKPGELDKSIGKYVNYRDKDDKSFFLKLISPLTITLLLLGGIKIAQKTTFSRRKNNELKATKELYDKQFGSLDSITIRSLQKSIELDKYKKNTALNEDQKKQLTNSAPFDSFIDDMLQVEKKKESYQNNLIEFTIKANELRKEVKNKINN